MQLDKTRITIRERGYLDLLDLSLHVIRSYAAPLAVTSALGALPMIVLNYLLLGHFLDDIDFDYAPEWVFGYCFYLVWLVILEIPLASAPMTLYLGQALFLEKPSVRRILADLWRSLGQLLICQVLLRAILIPWMITWFVLFATWPYLTEIILLERNPLWKSSKNTMTTFSRSSALHSRNSGDLFGRWIVAAAIGSLLVVGLWLAIYSLRAKLTNNLSFDKALFALHLQLVIWLVASYFNVVRFLSYLDLRIRNEGWEIELRMRAEAARLSRQLT